MRRVIFVALALVILLIGAGIFVLTANALATTATANTTMPATNSIAVTTSNTTIQEPVQAMPASSVPYGSDAEEEIATSAPKSQGHSCDSGY
ncbi:MAG: hypothetical protein HY868_09235 [Chloroflexi bacterium]|nr:hypothetical protein [Chloroflexota bacterium]